MHQPWNWFKSNGYKWPANVKAIWSNHFRWWWNNNITQSTFTECWLFNSHQSRILFEDCPFKLCAKIKLPSFDSADRARNPETIQEKVTTPKVWHAFDRSCNHNHSPTKICNSFVSVSLMFRHIWWKKHSQNSTGCHRITLSVIIGISNHEWWISD
jgi:hypothetical protein